jgi:secreted trypsin-like serine protease
MGTSKIAFGFFLFVASFAFADEYSHLLQDAVVNGKNVEKRSPLARTTVMILPVGSGTACSGTIIASDLVLTAAHCLTEDESKDMVKESELVVDFGFDYDGEEPLPRESSIGIKKMRIHPNYDFRLVKKATTPHDIALIRLDSPIPETHRAPRILPRSMSVEVGAEVKAAGYGDRSFAEPSPDYQLLSFDFVVAPFKTISNMVFVNATREGGIADGDSGGPGYVLIQEKWYFFGVISGSKEAGWARATFENIATYRDWLESTAKAFGSKLKLP